MRRFVLRSIIDMVIHSIIFGHFNVGTGMRDELFIIRAAYINHALAVVFEQEAISNSFKAVLRSRLVLTGTSYM